MAMLVWGPLLAIPRPHNRALACLVTTVAGGRWPVAGGRWPVAGGRKKSIVQLGA